MSTGSGEHQQLLLKALSSVVGLGEVERIISSKFNSESRLLSDISGYLLALGGKRVRPVLTLLSSQAFGNREPNRQTLDVAAGIELIHMATLLHDDIIDNSPIRRHKQSPLVKFGDSETLLCGDFLLTRAFSLCARLDGFTIDATEQACIALTEGEIDETPLYRTKHTVESCVSIARKKTASLFALACQCGAHFAGASLEATECMKVYGLELGTAFQMLDDVLDVTATELELGKQIGIDLRERKPSIINVLWLESDPAAQVLLSKPAPDEDSRKLVEQVLSSGVPEKAKALANSYAAKALTALKRAEELAANPSREDFERLRALVEFVVKRIS